MNDILNPYKNPFSKAVNTDRYMNHHRLVDEIKEDNKINYLLSQGWEYLDFKIDFNYLNKLDPFKLFKNTLNLIENCSRVVLHPSNHFLTSITSLFGREVQTYWYTYILSLNPNPISSAYINYCSLYDYSNSSSQTISDILISKVNSLLGKPTAIYQQFPYFTLLVLTYPVDLFKSIEELRAYYQILVQYPNEIISKKEPQSSSNKFDYGIFFPTTELRDYYVNLACQNLAIFKTKTQTVFGECNSKYPLSSFTNTDLTKKATIKVKDIEQSSNSAKLAILLTGIPGIGKTSWVNAFVKEVISPLGYLTINLDLESLSEFTPPDYVNKVCLVINDGDNLALSRESRTDGFTEKVMGLLDGNQVNCITPFNNSNLKLIIIITANTTERWDKAALRQGRIDIDYEFIKKAYIE